MRILAVVPNTPKVLPHEAIWAAVLGAHGHKALGRLLADATPGSVVSVQIVETTIQAYYVGGRSSPANSFVLVCPANSDLPVAVPLHPCCPDVPKDGPYCTQCVILDFDATLALEGTLPPNAPSGCDCTALEGRHLLVPVDAQRTFGNNQINDPGCLWQYIEFSLCGDDVAHYTIYVGLRRTAPNIPTLTVLVDIVVAGTDGTAYLVSTGAETVDDCDKLSEPITVQLNPIQQGWCGGNITLRALRAV